MKESKLFKSLVATFVVIVLGGPAVVLADTSIYIEDGNVSVSYADLNFANEQDVRVLYGRMKRASKEVCGSGTLRHGGSVIMKSTGVRCYFKTLYSAVDKIDNEDLSRIHAE